MPFDDNKSNFENMLDMTEGKKEALDSLPKSNDNEKVKGYNLTMKPSTRKKMTELAKRQGYNSASSFLNDLIEALYEEN